MDVTVLFAVPEQLPYKKSQLLRSLQSAVDQSLTPKQLLVLDGAGDQGLAEEVLSVLERSGLPFEMIPAKGQYLLALAHALDQVGTDYFVFLQNDRAPVYLQHSALELFGWAARRHPGTGLFYADYQLVDRNGSRKEVHLLEYHPGRVRDNLDMGRVFFVRTEAAKKAGGFSTRYRHGYFYDFRLRLSEQFELRLISNRYRGFLYTVEDRGKEHNVFDYLLSSKEVQLEMEEIVTEHLRRIGAYLAPGGYAEVSYTPEEEAGFNDCIASVVIPVNNRPQFIGKAIESVLNQTVRAVEAVVVVNGGEEDPTVEVVKSYLPGGKNHRSGRPPVRLIVHDINNIGLCLNAGLQAARGKYYVQLDSDDRLKPNAVEKLLEVFRSDPRIGMVIGSYEVWQLEDDGRYFRREDIPVVTHDEWTEENGRNNLLRINGAGAPRSAHIKVLREMGWFSVNDVPYSRNYGEDYEMVLKISEKYRIGRVWEPIYEVVRHSGGTDHAIDQETIDRNDNAKDHMRLEAIRRRQRLNREQRTQS